MGYLKTLLLIDPNHRLPAAEALKNPLFSNPHQQLSPAELQQLMSQLTEWKINPPHPAHVTALGPGKFN